MALEHWGTVWKSGRVLILASQSAARSGLLRNAGIAFEARAAGVNERGVEADARRENLHPAEIAMRLAERKALAIDCEAAIGADQILELDGIILHKAASIDDARQRLDQLRGRTHVLHTAVVLAIGGAIAWRHLEAPRLTMREFAADERDTVLALEGEAVLGSAGAYRLEGPSIRLFEAIEGDYFAILGLPLLPLLDALREKGFT